MKVPNIYIGLNDNDHQMLRCREGLVRDVLPIISKISSILIVGCENCSDILEVMYFCLPQTTHEFQRVVITDPDQEIVDRMEEQYKDVFPEVIFEQMNILDDKMIVTETFDLVMSMWGVEWVHEMEISLVNVKKLLNMKGYGYFLIESENPFFTKILTNLAKKHPWNIYLTDVLRGIPPFYNPRKASVEVKDVYTWIGLTPLHPEDDFINGYYFFNKVHLRECIMNTYSAPSLIPKNLHDYFFDCVEAEMIANGYTNRSQLDLENFVLPAMLLRTMFTKEEDPTKSPIGEH